MTLILSRSGLKVKVQLYLLLDHMRGAGHGQLFLIGELFIIIKCSGHGKDTRSSPIPES